MAEIACRIEPVDSELRRAMKGGERLKEARKSFGPDNPGWKKGIRIGSAKDGTVRYFIPDLKATTTEHSSAEFVAVVFQGSIYASVVRRQMPEKHIPLSGGAAGAPR